MEDQDRVIVHITDKGSIIIDYLMCSYVELVNLIVEKKCKIIFNNEDAFQNLKNGIEP